MMKHSNIKQAMASWCMLALSIFLPGCDETGENIDAPAIGSLVFRSYVTDPFSFKIYIDGHLMDGKKQFKYYSNTVRLKIVDVVNERVIFDDNYRVQSMGGTQVGVTVYQHSSGAVPVCLLPPADESVPPAGYGKIAFLYRVASFPDSLKAVVENTATPASTVYVPTDSMIVRKNEFSGFFLSRLGAKKAQVKLYPANGDRKQIGIISSSTLYSAESVFSMYIANSASGGAVPNVTAERIY
jgi:hypothetical protein